MQKNCIRIAALLTLLVIHGCSIFSSEDQYKETSDLTFYGTAASSIQLGENPFLTGVVENSILWKDDHLINLFDDGMNGNLTYALSYPSDNFHSLIDRTTCNIKVRFPYTIEYEGKFYTFGWRYAGDTLESYNIYLWSSIDCLTWAIENDGNPVLSTSSDPASIWYLIWNVAVSVDKDGTFILVAECAPNGTDQTGVGLGYSTGKLVNGKLNFDANRSASQIVKGGGNPYLYYSQKYDTFLILHGQNSTNFNAFSSGYWWVTASYYNRNYNKWFTKPSLFSLGKDGVPVCDPHAAVVEIDGVEYIRIIFSYAQNSLYSVFLNGNLDDLLLSVMK